MIGDRQREIHRRIRRGAERGIVDVDRDDVAGLGFEIEDDARPEIQSAARDLKRAGIGTREAQCVRAESVIGDDDVAHLHRSRRAGVFLDRVERIGQRYGRGRAVRARRRRVNPELREIDAAAAVLVHDVNVPCAIHRDAFVLLVGSVQRIAQVRGEVQRALDVSGAIDENDAGVLLADNEQVARLRLAAHRGEIRKRKHVGHVGQAEFRGVEKVRRICRGGRAVGRGAGRKINPGLENADRSFFLQDNEAVGLRIPRQAFGAGVVVEGAEFHGLGSRAGQRGARGIGKLHELPVALLGQHELTAAEVGDAFRIVEVRALRRTGPQGQRHGVNQLAGLGNLGDGATAVANDEQRVGVPIVGYARGFLAQQIAGRRPGRQRGARRLRQVVAPDPDVVGEIDRSRGGSDCNGCGRAVGRTADIGGARPIAGRRGEGRRGEAGRVGADGRGGNAGGALIPLDRRRRETARRDGEGHRATADN